MGRKLSDRQLQLAALGRVVDELASPEQAPESHEELTKFGGI